MSLLKLCKSRNGDYSWRYRCYNWGRKKGKRVIAVPRLAKYGEHVDDHQLQLIRQFDEMNIIYPCYELENLEDAVKETRVRMFNKYVSNTETIINSIEVLIEKYKYKE